MTHAIDENRQRVERIARKKGYVLNTNEHWVQEILRLMTNNQNEHGKYICPCNQHFPPDIEHDEVCPCASLDQEITQNGYCDCRLFFKKGHETQKLDILATISCPG